MKLVLLAFTAVAGATGICDLCVPGSAFAAKGTGTGAIASAAAADTVTLHIEGMDCGGCTVATKKVLERLEGVAKAEVSFEKKRAVVTYDPQRVTVNQMIAAVATLKYTATVAAQAYP